MSAWHSYQFFVLTYGEGLGHDVELDFSVNFFLSHLGILKENILLERIYEEMSKYGKEESFSAKTEEYVKSRLPLDLNKILNKYESYILTKIIKPI